MTRTTLVRPPTFSHLPLPAQADPTVEDTWLQFIQRSINLFYQCAAVESIDLIGDSDSTTREIRLRLGIDAAWIEPHLEDFGARITEARAAAGLGLSARYGLRP